MHDDRDDQVRALFRRIDDGPPLDIDVHDVMTRGKRVRARRTGLAVVGSTLAVAGAVVVSLALVAGARSPNLEPAEPPGVTSSVPEPPPATPPSGTTSSPEPDTPTPPDNAPPTGNVPPPSGSGNAEGNSNQPSPEADEPLPPGDGSSE